MDDSRSAVGPTTAMWPGAVLSGSTPVFFSKTMLSSAAFRAAWRFCTEPATEGGILSSGLEPCGSKRPSWKRAV
jgi:hypothetical protein